MYKICFYVPESHLNAVKNAMFEKGAGKIGNYACCAWQTEGQGQYTPLTGSHPFLGDPHQLETVKEYQVEMVCEDIYIRDVIKALKQVHPYETPAYQAWKIET